MQRNVFLTGFPGFIAKQLLRRLARRDPGAHFTFLIQESLRGTAEAALAELERDHPGFRARSELCAGDITLARLGLDDLTYDRLVEKITHVWHLAAIYDLSVPEVAAYNVNVVGTGNMLDFAASCSQLRRLDYVSTCYVSGTRKGTVLEDELDEGQSFKNHYESTKCWAEVEVRRRMDQLPIAIHRPSIVVGDSQSGYTDKYDGPYFIVRLLMRLPAWMPMPNIGDGLAHPNIAPVDFVVDAMAEIWSQENTTGKTFALADPNPHTSQHIIETTLATLGKKPPRGSVPSSWLEGALRLPPLRKLVKIPREAVIYFNHEVFYDTTNTRAALEGSGIRCPDFLAILPTLIDYVRTHPEKGFLDNRKL